MPKKITSLTAEQESRLSEYRDKWIRIALSTGRMTDDERERVTDAVRGMYESAKLKSPRVVIVPSPLVLSFAGGAAAWVWHQRKTGEADATHAATDAATYAATAAATAAATDAATVDATVDATYDATDAATAAATRAATDAATAAATHDATAAATAAAVAECARKWWRPTAGGQNWAGWTAFLDFWSTILADRSDCAEAFRAFADYRALAELSGYRWIHEEFCMVSEKPVRRETYLGANGAYVLHCEDGPSMQWADGFATWHWHGTAVPAWVIMEPDKITPEAIKAEGNAEVRRAMRERYGEGRYLQDTGANLIEMSHEGAESGACPRALIQDNEGRRFLVGNDGSTGRVYYMEVDPATKTCRQAHESLCGFDESTIRYKS